jgi:hypothetical protein
MKEFMRGHITHRELRVLIQHLPLNSAAYREKNGAWQDAEWISHAIESQIRLLRADLRAIATGQGEQPEFLPTPPPSEAVLRQRKKERKRERRKQAELLAVWAPRPETPPPTTTEQ